MLTALADEHADELLLLVARVVFTPIHGPDLERIWNARWQAPFGSAFVVVNPGWRAHAAPAAPRAAATAALVWGGVVPSPSA